MSNRAKHRQSIPTRQVGPLVQGCDITSVVATFAPIPSSYVDDVDPIVLSSARRHSVADDDMLHAFRNPVRVFVLDDLHMLIGPDTAGRLLEVGVASADGIEFVVPAMPARNKFLR